MKNNYEEPRICIVILSTEDVIATSGGGNIAEGTDEDNNWSGLVPADLS